MLRWHPAEGGAQGYVVEAAIVEALPRGKKARKKQGYGQLDDGEGGVRALGGAAGATAAGREGVATSAAIPSWQLAWTELTQTSVPCATVGGLSPSAVYRVRVRAIGPEGGASSSPSPETALVTPEPSDWKFPGPNRAADEFVIDSESDSVLGDAILFTEQVPLDGGPALPGVRVGAGPSAELNDAGRRKWLRAREKLSELGDQSSATSDGDDLAFEKERLERLIGRVSGVGERTVAARVVSVHWPGADRAARLAEKLRSQREEAEGESGDGEDGALRDAGELVRVMTRERRVTLQVVWSRGLGPGGDRDGGRDLQLDKGCLVERKGWELDIAGVHRLPWLEEDGRWSAAEEAARLLRDWAGV